MESQSERPIDFMVSYTGVDRNWAEWIAWQLEADGYHAFIQSWDIRPGANFVTAMHDAVQRAKRIVIVLSPHYLASDFANAEWKGFFARDSSGSQAVMLPVRVGLVEPPGLLRTINYVDVVGLDGMAARSALLAAARGIRGKPVNEPEFPGSPVALAAAASPLPEFPGNSKADANAPTTCEVRADDLGALRTFVADVAATLKRRGFSEKDLEAFHISFRELVDNVARHVPDNPSLTLTLGHEPRDPYNTHESAWLEVTDGGSGFDFKMTLEELERDFSSTDREHGLLRVCRLTSTLFQRSIAPHRMIFQKERSPQVSSMAFPEGSVVPFVFAYRQEAIRVGSNVHTFYQFTNYLHRAPVFMDLIFDPLLRPTQKHIGIEILGEGWTNVLPWEDVLDRLVQFNQRSEEFGKILLLYADTGAGEQRRLRKYCKRAGIRMFEDAKAIPAVLG
jgi:anti-sigma regulatory factor (Ser/Thr protein kinase)